MPKPASTRPAYKMLTCIYLCRTLLFFAPYADFCLKNDGEAAVVLEVNLWGMPEGEFISTRFETGWNPEIIREIKETSSATALIWGY